MRASHKERTARFRELHQGPLLRLPNAWDAASARLFEDTGFLAIGTTSAGIAYSLGFPDGQRIPFPEMLAAITRIVDAVHIPVSADIEAGFGKSSEEVARNCRAVLEVGAVGVNLEDGTRDRDHPLTDVSLVCEKIQAVKAAAASAGDALFVNARTDVYLRAVGEPQTRLAVTLSRCNAYRSAGADCLFVPGVTDAETIGRLAREIDGPLNVLAGPGTPSTEDLAKLGVARLSLGSGPMRASLGLLRSIAKELLEEGTYTSLLAGAIPYAEANELFARE